jgi:hypothetical protein
MSIDTFYDFLAIDTDIVKWIERVAITNTLTDLRTRIEGLRKVAKTLPASVTLSKELSHYGEGLQDGLEVAHSLLDNTIRGFAEKDND